MITLRILAIFFFIVSNPCTMNCSQLHDVFPLTGSEGLDCMKVDNSKHQKIVCLRGLQTLCQLWFLLSLTLTKWSDSENLPLNMPGRPFRESASSCATEHVSPETRAFMLPVATPPKATVFGTRKADFLKAGLVINIVAGWSSVLCHHPWNGKHHVCSPSSIPVRAFIPPRGVSVVICDRARQFISEFLNF